MLWDLNEAKHLYTLTGGDVINSLVFSPNRCSPFSLLECNFLVPVCTVHIKITNRPSVPVCIPFRSCFSPVPFPFSSHSISPVLKLPLHKTVHGACGISQLQTDPPYDSPTIDFRQIRLMIHPPSTSDRSAL